MESAVEREQRLQSDLAGHVFAPVDAVFDLLEESGATFRRQAEASRAAGRAPWRNALAKTQAEPFERTIDASAAGRAREGGQPRGAAQRRRSGRSAPLRFADRVSAPRRWRGRPLRTPSKRALGRLRTSSRVVPLSGERGVERGAQGRRGRDGPDLFGDRLEARARLRSRPTQPRSPRW